MVQTGCSLEHNWDRKVEQIEQKKKKVSIYLDQCYLNLLLISFLWCLCSCHKILWNLRNLWGKMPPSLCWCTISWGCPSHSFRCYSCFKIELRYHFPCDMFPHRPYLSCNVMLPSLDWEPPRVTDHLSAFSLPAYTVPGTQNILSRYRLDASMNTPTLILSTLWQNATNCDLKLKVKVKKKKNFFSTF